MNNDKPMQIAAVLSGGDWADALVDHLLVPEGCDFEAAQRDWRAWYEGTYRPALNYWRDGEKGPKPPKFVSISDWLVRHHGAQHTEVIEIDTETGIIYKPKEQP